MLLCKYVAYCTTVSLCACFLFCFVLLYSGGLTGGRLFLMSLPCLESQGCRLIPSFYLLFLLFCLVLLLLLSSPFFSAFGPVSCLLSRKSFLFPSSRHRLLFFYTTLGFNYFVSQLGHTLVCDKCNMQPYDTGISHFWFYI